MEHVTIGAWGETLACDYLSRKGYKIVDRNRRIGRDEIDIIALAPNGDIALIEVKTKTTLSAGSASEELSNRKLKALARSAARYAYDNNVPEDQISVEAIAIDVSRSKKMANIKHFKTIL